MKYFVKFKAFEKDIAARAILKAMWRTDVSTMPENWKKAYESGDLNWALETHATFTGTWAREGMKKGFKTLKAADRYACTLRRSVDIGQGMLIGSKVIESLILDEISIKRSEKAVA